MRYFPVKLQRNLCAVSVRVLPVNVCALCLFALLFSVSDSFTPLDSVLKGGLSHWCVGLMPRVLQCHITCPFGGCTIPRLTRQWTPYRTMHFIVLRTNTRKPNLREGTLVERC